VAPFDNLVVSVSYANNSVIKDWNTPSIFHIGRCHLSIFHMALDDEKLPQTSWHKSTTPRLHDKLVFSLTTCSENSSCPFSKVPFPGHQLADMTRQVSIHLPLKAGTHRATTASEPITSC